VVSATNYRGSNVSDLIKLSAVANGFEDNTYLYFTDDNTDTEKLFSTSAGVPQIYSTENDSQLATNKLQDLRAEQSVALGFTCSISGTYRISASEFTFANTSVTLEDTKTNTFTELAQGTSYEFAYTQGEPAERFVLHFNRQSSGTETVSANSMTVFASDNTVFVSNIGTCTGSMSIVNTLGQTVYTGTLRAETVINIPAGVYIVKINGESQKIVVK
jgi:hypothetical protein